jgi:hypothetical protein
LIAACISFLLTLKVRSKVETLYWYWWVFPFEWKTTGIFAPFGTTVLRVSFFFSPPICLYFLISFFLTFAFFFLTTNDFSNCRSGGMVAVIYGVGSSAGSRITVGFTGSRDFAQSLQMVVSGKTSNRIGSIVLLQIVHDILLFNRHYREYARRAVPNG